MEPKAIMTVRVLKRLKAAVGYHELGMTRQALNCLDSLASLGSIEPFGTIVDVLRDEFLKHKESDVSAANALETIAGMLPRPERRAIRMTLAACYGKSEGTRRAGAGTASDRAADPEIHPKSER